MVRTGGRPVAQLAGPRDRVGDELQQHFGLQLDVRSHRCPLGLAQVDVPVSVSVSASVRVIVVVRVVVVVGFV